VPVRVKRSLNTIEKRNITYQRQDEKKNPRKTTTHITFSEKNGMKVYYR
jgi:hypothetical protein